MFILQLTSRANDGVFIKASSLMSTEMWKGAKSMSKWAHMLSEHTLQAVRGKGQFFLPSTPGILITTVSGCRKTWKGRHVNIAAREKYRDWLHHYISSLLVNSCYCVSYKWPQYWDQCRLQCDSVQRCLQSVSRNRFYQREVFPRKSHLLRFTSIVTETSCCLCVSYGHNYVWMNTQASSENEETAKLTSRQFLYGDPTRARDRLCAKMRFLNVRPKHLHRPLVVG